MHTVSQREFHELLTFSQPGCVSLYIPTDPIEPNPELNRTQFKNAMHTVLTQLEKLKETGAVYASLQKELDTLQVDTLFWKQQEKCLALFASSAGVRKYTLPHHHPELWMINDHFYVVPLIQSLQEKVEYFVLDLDKEHSKMWRGSEQELQPIKVPDLPESMNEVNGIGTNERSVQFHTSPGSTKGGNRPAIFHGSSSLTDDHDLYMKRFLQAVDKSILAFFHAKTPLLLLSGVEELVSTYKKVSHYQHIVDKTLSKNGDPNQHLQELQKKAWEAVKPYIEKKKTDALTRFHEEPQADRKVTVLPEVLRQVALGKVDTVFIAAETLVWGMFDETSGTAVIENAQQPRSAELLNVAARLSLLKSGSAIVLPAAEMPAGAQAAALLRY